MADPQKVNVEFFKEIVNSEQFKILNDLIYNPDATVDNALDQIIDLTLSAHTAPIGEEYFTPGNVDYYLSLALMEHVQNLEPVKQKRLVEFIHGLQKRTARDSSTGEPLRVQGRILWTDLPSFGYTEYETWDSNGGDYTDPWSLDLQGEPRQRWMNENAFVVQFTQATHISYNPPDQGSSIHRLDRSLRAIMTLRLGLENDKVPMETLSKTAAMEAACV